MCPNCFDLAAEEPPGRLNRPKQQTEEQNKDVCFLLSFTPCTVGPHRQTTAKATCSHIHKILAFGERKLYFPMTISDEIRLKIFPSA